MTLQSVSGGNVATLKDDHTIIAMIEVARGVVRPTFVIWNHELYELVGGPSDRGPWEYDRRPVWWAEK